MTAHRVTATAGQRERAQAQLAAMNRAHRLQYGYSLADCAAIIARADAHGEDATAAKHWVARYEEVYGGTGN